MKKCLIIIVQDLDKIILPVGLKPTSSIVKAMTALKPNLDGHTN